MPPYAWWACNPYTMRLAMHLRYPQGTFKGVSKTHTLTAGGCTPDVRFAYPIFAGAPLCWWVYSVFQVEHLKLSAVPLCCGGCRKNT